MGQLLLIIYYYLVQENYFQNREFSFTLADDVYIRYQSFNDQAQLEEEIRKLCPHKIDIGAVYNYRYIQKSLDFVRINFNYSFISMFPQTKSTQNSYTIHSIRKGIGFWYWHDRLWRGAQLLPRCRYLFKMLEVYGYCYQSFRCCTKRYLKFHKIIFENRSLKRCQFSYYKTSLEHLRWLWIPASPLGFLWSPWSALLGLWWFSTDTESSCSFSHSWIFASC